LFALDRLASVYLLVGTLIGIYVAFIAPGAIVLEPMALFRDVITVLLYALLWPFFLFGGLSFRLR
jgi:hypothetical protein